MISRVTIELDTVTNQQAIDISNKRRTKQRVLIESFDF